MSPNTTISLTVSGEPRTLVVDAAHADGPLSRVLQAQGVPLNTRCGERGICDGCRVRLDAGRLCAVDGSEPVEGPLESVRTCCHRIDGTDLTLDVPDRSVVADEQQVLEDFLLRVPLSADPMGTERYGLAVDLGTTTVVVALVDLERREMVRTASGVNRQVHLGEDVLTRINLCRTDPAALAKLQHAVVDLTFRPLIRSVLKGTDVESIGAMAVAGNPTMLHLLVGEDPSPMGVAPFTPVFLEHRTMPLSQLFHDAAWATGDLHLLPAAASYVGSDITGGCVASGMFYQAEPSLLVDLGTNGEIVLRGPMGSLGCATAAGPAFEGRGLSNGCRATQGAIEHVDLCAPGEPAIKVIGDARPMGLCGSAYVDVLADGATHGRLTPAGRFSESLREDYAEQIASTEGHGLALQLATGRGRTPIVVSEADVAALLQARAAIAAGIDTLLARAELRAEDLGEVLVAGGFAMHLTAEKLIDSGLLPGVRVDQVQPIGNGSLASAYAALLDEQIIPEVGRIAERVETVELNLDPRFESAYLDHLMV